MQQVSSSLKLLQDGISVIKLLPQLRYEIQCRPEFFAQLMHECQSQSSQWPGLAKTLEKMLAVGKALNAEQLNAEQLEVLFAVFYKTENLSATFCY